MNDVTDQLGEGRAAVDRRAWDVACTLLAAADEHGGLVDPEDLQRLALSAYLTGRDEVAESGWTRAYRGFLERGDVRPAARCAFWLGLVLIIGRGADVRGGGWIAEGQRLVDEHGPSECPERGYLLLPAALSELAGGDPSIARTSFAEATAIGQRFDEVDLIALGRLGQGQALIRMGDAPRGLQLFDEVMVAVDAGRVSPIAAGLVYCAVILACQQVYDVRRAQQWTAALSGWCASQPGLVPFRGQCLVHRSELAQLRGDWAEAVAEAEQACRWLSDPPDRALGMAHYQRAELHRLRGELDAAEASFEHAAARGHDPHPGLALVWLDQGRTAAAAAAVRRAIGGTPDRYPSVTAELEEPRPRAEKLATYVDIMVVAEDLDAARAACTELADIAEDAGTRFISAMAAHARGTVLLATDQPGPALEALTEACETWMELQAPYQAARSRVLAARALRALGDEDTAAVELRAARKVFEDVGAEPDLHRLEGSAVTRDPATTLTARELEVIRLVAAGHTNREIADRLVISDKTVARHLHNVFAKLDLPNRTAATAYAYEHGLV